MNSPQARSNIDRSTYQNTSGSAVQEKFRRSCGSGESEENSSRTNKGPERAGGLVPPTSFSSRVTILRDVNHSWTGGPKLPANGTHRNAIRRTASSPSIPTCWNSSYTNCNPSLPPCRSRADGSNWSIFTVPFGNFARTSSSPPKALTIFRSVETCMSDCFSSFDRLGCFMPRASAT